jgi:hypothetical protein
MQRWHFGFPKRNSKKGKYSTTTKRQELGLDCLGAGCGGGWNIQFGWISIDTTICWWFWVVGRLPVVHESTLSLSLSLVARQEFGKNELGHIHVSQTTSTCVTYSQHICHFSMSHTIKLCQIGSHMGRRRNVSYYKIFVPLGTWNDGHFIQHSYRKL